MTSVSVGPKGQITIPKHLRDRFGVRTGAKVDVEERDGQIVVETRSLEDRLTEFWDTLPSRPGRSSLDADGLKELAREQYDDVR